MLVLGMSGLWEQPKTLNCHPCIVISTDRGHRQFASSYTHSQEYHLWCAWQSSSITHEAHTCTVVIVVVVVQTGNRRHCRYVVLDLCFAQLQEELLWRV